MTHKKETVGDLAGVTLNESNSNNFDLVFSRVQASDLMPVL